MSKENNEQTQGVPAGPYTVEKHGDGFAIYTGRTPFHRGMNWGQLTECSEALATAVERGLNMLSAAPQAQPVEAEQASVVTHEPVAVVVTWRVPGGTETGVEWMDAPPPDGTKLYVAAQPAQPVAYRVDYPVDGVTLGGEIEKARNDERLFGVGFTVNGWHVPAHLVARWGAVVKSPAPAQAQPVREPMSWDLFVAACEAEYGEEFCPNNLGDVSDEEKAELMRVVSIVERHHDIGGKGGDESKPTVQHKEGQS